MSTKIPYKFVITQDVNDKRTENSHSCYLKIENKYIKLFNVTEMQTDQSREIKMRFESKIFKGKSIYYDRFSFKKDLIKNCVKREYKSTAHKAISAECHYWGKNSKGEDNSNYPEVITKYRLDKDVQNHNKYLPRVLGYGSDKTVPIYKILVNIKNIIRKRHLFKNEVEPYIHPIFTSQITELKNNMILFCLYKSSNALINSNFNSGFNHIIYIDKNFDYAFQLGIESKYSKFVGQIDVWLLEKVKNSFIAAEFYGQKIQDEKFENGEEVYREVVIIN